MQSAFEVQPKGKWQIDDNGFMRCRCRFLSTGIMQYLAEELGDAGKDIPPESIMNIMVDLDSLSDPHAVRSLEGMPVVAYDHAWCGPDEEFAQVGNIAGTPTVSGPYLEGDVVITHPQAIQAIQDGVLSDISAGYQALYVMEPGSHDGQEYHGKQTQIRYNHIALLRPGEGRGGSDIRVLNKQREKSMSQEFTAIQLESGQTVRVHNSDVSTLNKFLDDHKKVTVTNQETASSLEDKMKELEAAKAEAATANGKVEELTAQLQETKDQLEQAMAPETIEAAANEMVEEREEATEMMNGAGLKDEAMNDAKKLRGHELRLHVVNAIRTQNGKPAIEGDEAKNEHLVKGHYQALKDSPVLNKKPAAAGAGIVKTQNKGNGEAKRKSGTAALGYASK